MRLAIAVGLVCTVNSIGAWADTCSDDEIHTTWLTESSSPKLSEVIVVGSKIDATSPTTNENWKEIHCAAGVLQKVGLGVGHPVDPQKQVGTWSLGIDTVTYTYASSYTWRVYSNGSATSLCWQENADGGNVIAIGTITTGASCDLTPP